MKSKNLNMKGIDSPLVSICCITFNHAFYIRQCLDGFLMQETDFAFEVLIHDDASTDDTADIIREYESKYPDIIKPIYQTENQWVKGRRGSVIFNFPRAKGKYIALCEGDDYWTDPLKLQKQVDLLEKYKEASLCCGGYNSKEFNNILSEHIFSKGGRKYFLFTLSDWVNAWYTKTLTVMFRKELLDDYLDVLPRYNYARDIHLFYHLLKKGKGIYISELLGTYNIHDGGICSKIDVVGNAKNNLNCMLEIHKINKDSNSQKMLYNSLLGFSFFDSEDTLPFKKEELFKSCLKNAPSLKNKIKATIYYKVDMRLFFRIKKIMKYRR